MRRKVLLGVLAVVTPGSGSWNRFLQRSGGRKTRKGRCGQVTCTGWRSLTKRRGR